MKKIVILTWWTWYEREVAINSSKFFKDNLELDYDYYLLPEQLDDFLKNKDKYNLAIPVFHWEYWEDWKIFAFLDILNIPFVFSSFEVHALCLDKFNTNSILKNIWIKIPWQYIYNWEIKDLDFPLIVKPNKWWSSIFTYKANDIKELKKAIKDIQDNTKDDILIQEFITWTEVSVPVINWEVYPIMSLEKIDENLFFDYEAKYENDSKIKEVFDKLDKNTTEILSKESKKIYNFLWCRWIVRIDFIVKNNIAYFLEVNTIPWMTNASILPKSWRLTWKTNKDLVLEILKNNLWKN